MAVEIEQGHGPAVARATCNGCGAVIEISASTPRNNDRTRTTKSLIGVVAKRLTYSGWNTRGKKHLCPACLLRGENPTPQEAPMTAPTQSAEANAMAANLSQLRQPTREQKRHIVSLLESSYDTVAGRYKGLDTDKTVAETIGGGVMPGWVAEIREDLFGADGGNDELGDLLDDVRHALAESESAVAALRKASEAIAEDLRARCDHEKGRQDKLKAFETRLMALKKTFGPKAERI